MTFTDHVFGHPYEKHGSGKVWKVRTISPLNEFMFCDASSQVLAFGSCISSVLIEIFAIQTINIMSIDQFSL